MLKYSTFTKLDDKEGPFMLTPQQILSSIHEQVGQFIPDVAKSAQDDLHNHVKMVVSSVLSKLDLVTREEFETQQAVLHRTRAMLETLEKQVSELEKTFADK
ncbi:accessory factor UbiK family protein [Alkalimarinus alittae]|uniref:Ubiquinone biosynthesis accessory factor UbiK n=1 Tax=Alkalimarinus alittae TaxID=2961619 RepID=A0ABY6N1G1_9ALTE|nr:accessory factor UbiK family protein [Alkalimarinus alittae]UZE95951.1 accessory factor UbiK family protein [Alkalimarinus alittae]